MSWATACIRFWPAARVICSGPDPPHPGRDRLGLRRDADLPVPAKAPKATREQRKVMLAGKVEDMLNTVVRQISMHCFETKLHDERRGGELLPERLGEIWVETQQDSLGPAHSASMRTTATTGPTSPTSSTCPSTSTPMPSETAWSTRSMRFTRTARRGLCRRSTSTCCGPAEASATSELLAPFGLDASDPNFWNKGLDLTSSFIDELEALS